jgi:hypothetical protein
MDTELVWQTGDADVALLRNLNDNLMALHLLAGLHRDRKAQQRIKRFGAFVIERLEAAEVGTDPNLEDGNWAPRRRLWDDPNLGQVAD